jgi:tetratricopeptide (TPR) repeat protein
VSLAQMREYDQAIADFNRALDLNPNYANAWFNRGELRYAKGNYTEAIDDYNQALRLNPRDAAAYNSRGHARYRIGQFREALDDYNQSVQFDSKNAAAFTNRGDAYMDQGQYERAATDYRTAIQLDSKYGRAYQSAAWLMATCPDERFRDTKKAIEAAEKALQLDGADDYHYLDSLAAAYANAGRYDDAQSTLKQALTMTPEADAPRLKERLSLYEQNEPYRDSPRVALRRPQRRPGATTNQ